MGATTYTPTLDLPQFADSDRPTWRGDITDAFNKIDADAANFKSKVDGIALGVSTDSFRNGKNFTGDQSAMLNAWLADSTLSGVRRLVGTFTLNAGITVPSGVTVDARQATLIQGVPNIKLVTVQGGGRFYRGRLVGLTTDFIARSGSFSFSSFAMYVDGQNIPNTFVEETIFTGFGQANLYLVNAPQANVNGVTVYGPNGKNGVVVPANDASAFGLYVANACPDLNVDTLYVDNTSIGMITSYDTTDLTLHGAKIKNIPGQHGAYLQSGTNLSVSDLKGDSVNLNLCKLQIHSANNANQLSPVFENVSGTNIGDTVLSLNNTDANLAGGYKIFSPSINNVAGENAGRVLYLGSVVGATANNIAGYSTVNDTVTILDAVDTVVSNIASHGSGKLGIRMTAAPGAVTTRTTIKGARIYNPGGSNVAGSTYGMNVSCTGGPGDGTNLTVDDVHVFADNGLLTTGIEYDAVDTSTLRQRNCSAIGASSRPFRLPAGCTTLHEWSNNDNYASATLNYPVAAVVKTGSNGDNGIYSSNAMPVTGSYLRGDLCYNTAPSASSTPGWINTASGGAYSSTWTAGSTYAAGVQVRTSGGRIILCITGGTSGATEPVMPAINQTVTDGSVVWQYVNSSLAAFKAMANVSA